MYNDYILHEKMVRVRGVTSIVYKCLSNDTFLRIPVESVRHLKGYRTRIGGLITPNINFRSSISNITVT